jgi:hypothetical protein
MLRSSIKYAQKEPLCERVVFVDGLARCAKFLTCRVLSHLKHGEHWQYPVAVEHMCYMVYLGVIDTEVAMPFVQLMVDEQTYNRIIGRFLNTRFDDASSIFQSPDYAQYILRSVSPRDEVAVEKFKGEGRFPIYQSHNAMASGSFLLKALPESQIVHISRHPVDQVYKWQERGWGQRETEDPLSFVPIVEAPGGPVPWFAHDWSESYVSANPMERVVDSVLFLQQADEKGIASLNSEQSNRLHRITLEHLVTTPEDVVAGISAFLQSEPHELMNAMLLEERVPRVLDRSARQRMFREIDDTCSKDRIERLLDESRAFEARWGLDPFET